VHGTVSGSQVPVVDAVALSGPIVPTGATATYQAVQIWITNQSSLCSILLRAGNPPNATVLLIAIESVSDVVPGTYVMNTTGSTVSSASVSAYSAVDGSCAVTSSAKSVGGTVTLNSITSTTITGTFTFDYDTGDTLTGAFSVPVCAADMNTLQNATTACGQ
jgi:hypothetical protein